MPSGLVDVDAVGAAPVLVDVLYISNPNVAKHKQTHHETKFCGGESALCDAV